MTNGERINRMRKEAYDIQMAIASDLERFGNTKAASACRDEAFMGIIRPEFWNNRVSALFDIDDI